MIEEKHLRELTDEEFDTVIEGAIEQIDDDTDELEMSTFFRLWNQIERKRLKPVIQVTARVVGGQLTLTLPQTAPPNVSVHENTVTTPYEQIVVSLE